MELCLREVSKCNLFVGLLGERYGFVPDSYNVSDTTEFPWLANYPKGRSITELEMYSVALSKSLDSVKHKAYFYFRDPSFEKYVITV